MAPGGPLHGNVYTPSLAYLLHRGLGFALGSAAINCLTFRKLRDISEPLVPGICVLGVKWIIEIKYSDA